MVRAYPEPQLCSGVTELNDYYASAIVRQLDRDGQLRAYSFEGIWPKEIEAIGLDFEANNVEDYGVTFAVQYWSATEGRSYTSSTPRDANAQLNSVTT